MLTKHLTKCLSVFTTAPVLVASLSTQALGDIRDDIFDRATTIRSEVFRSEASDRDLQEAQRLMGEALRLVLSQGGGTPSPACTEYAYAKYYANLDSSTAQSKAVAACRQILDLDIAKYLWEKHYANQTSARAMDLAAEGATRYQRGKIQIIQYAWGKFYANQTSSQAASNAAVGAASVRDDALECLQASWQRHYQTQTSANAMTAAFRDCAS